MVLGLCAWAPLAFVWSAVGPQPGDPGINCGGMGWGEMPCGWDAVGIAYLVIGVPFAAGSVAALTMLEILGARAQSARLAVSVLFSTVPWAFALYVVVSQ